MSQPLWKWRCKQIINWIKSMPLKFGKKNISANIRELYKDNKKSGKARGAKGKPRSRAQMIAIAISAATKKSKKKK